MSLLHLFLLQVLVYQVHLTRPSIIALNHSLFYHIIAHQFIVVPPPDPHWRENERQRQRRIIEEERERLRQRDCFRRELERLVEPNLVHRPLCKYSQKKPLLFFSCIHNFFFIHLVREAIQRTRREHDGKYQNSFT
jgi:hypothetical protein